VGKIIVGKSLWLVEFDTLLSVESLRELITVADAEDAAVDVQVLRNVEIPPSVVLGLILRERQSVALEENALRHTGVLDTWLNDVGGVILEVVVDDAVTDTEVLVGVLDDWLLEVSIELEHLSVILEPLGRDLWNAVVDLGFSGRYSGQTDRSALTHGLEELRVDVFFEVDSLLCHGAVLDAEQLRLVVAGDRRIGVGVPREER
jgi:hypothetical protein